MSNYIKLAALLEANAVEIKQAAAENRELRAKVAAYEKKELCQKLASEMVRKGLASDFLDTVNTLTQHTEEKLAAISEAVNLTATNNYVDYRSGLPDQGETYSENPAFKSSLPSVNALDSWASGG